MIDDDDNDDELKLSTLENSTLNVWASAAKSRRSRRSRMCWFTWHTAI